MITVFPELVDPAQVVAPAHEPEIISRPVAPADVPPSARCVDLDYGNGWHVLLDGFNWRGAHPVLGETMRYLNREGSEHAIEWGNYAPEL